MLDVNEKYIINLKDKLNKKEAPKPESNEATIKHINTFFERIKKFDSLFFLTFILNVSVEESSIF